MLAMLNDWGGTRGGDAIIYVSIHSPRAFLVLSIHDHSLNWAVLAVEEVYFGGHRGDTPLYMKPSTPIPLASTSTWSGRLHG